MKFTWEKMGLVFDIADHQRKDWSHTHAQAPASLDLGDVLRIYYATRPQIESGGQYTSRLGYVDFSKDEFPKIIDVAENPILELGGTGCFDEFGTYPFSPIASGDEILGYFGGWTRCESVPFNVGVGVSKSIDNGKTFQRIGPGPVISYSPDEPFVLSGPKIRFFNEKYYLFYIAGREWINSDGLPEPVYRIRAAESLDGINWVKFGFDLIDAVDDLDEAQASPDVFFHDGVFHMFFCYRRTRNYRGKDGSYRIGYAWSKDLKNWMRDDAKSGLDVSATGWDSEMVAYPHVFEVKSQIYVAYLGNSVGRAGFGMARLVNTQES